jgi:acetate kinase
LNVLVLNSGSSSVKFKVINAKSFEVLSSGHVDGVGLDSCVFILNGSSKRVLVKNHVDAISLILGSVDKSLIGAVGHRFVHGGDKFKVPVFVSDDVIFELESLCDLAPLHNPHNLSGIKASFKLLSVPQIVVFDTSFHSSLSESAFTYALPRDLCLSNNIRKFGFHGIAHSYLLLKSQELLGSSKLNLITCHLGNGCSITCIKNNVSIDTSMGFSPLQGLVMGTRSGDVDPCLALYLQKHLNMSCDDVGKLLNYESGLKGICGEADMRLVYEKMLDGDSNASLALEVFILRIVHYIGAYIARMGDDVHGIVFSGGIGEGAFYVRKKVCDSLKHLGVVIDYEKNMYNKGVINEPLIINQFSSKIKILAIPANEELMIALEVFRLLDSS